MKISVIIICFKLLLLASCNVKEPCEIYNQGELCITNNTNSILAVYSEGSKLMEVHEGEKKCVDQSVGTYTLKCFSGTEEWTIHNVVIIQCKPTKVIVP